MLTCQWKSKSHCDLSPFFPFAMTNLYVENMTVKMLLAAVEGNYPPPPNATIIKKTTQSQNEEKTECTVTVLLWISLIYSGAILLPRTSRIRCRHYFCKLSHQMYKPYRPVVQPVPCWLRLIDWLLTMLCLADGLQALHQWSKHCHRISHKLYNIF